MKDQLDRVRRTVFSLLLDSVTLDGWVAALRRSPALKNFTLWIQSPPFPALTPFELAKIVHVDERAFRRRVKMLVALTPIEVATALQLAAAIRQLGAGDVSVKTIAELAGFADSSAFVYHFVLYMGRVPSTFRQCDSLAMASAAISASGEVVAASMAGKRTARRSRKARPSREIPVCAVAISESACRRTSTRVGPVCTSVRSSDVRYSLAAR